MWSTWVKGATLLLLIAALVQARKEGCTCGGLGSGSDPCNCDEVVVKAAKLPKAVQYASPEAINEAATRRDCEPSANPTTLQTNSASSSQNGIFVNAISHSSSSASSSSSSTSNGDCGCNRKKTPTSLQVQELLNSNPNTVLVPRFPPIGDLCHTDKQGENLLVDNVRVKVTPAYPGKLKCCEGTPYEECVRIIQGIRGGPSRMIDISNGAYNENYGSSESYGSSGNYGSNVNYVSNGNVVPGFGNFGPTFGTPMGHVQSNIISGAYSGDSSVSYSSQNFVGGSNEGNFIGGSSQYYPLNRLPADPISLTIAYKNLVAPAIYYNKKGKQLVSEGGLAFGHRTIPSEVRNEKKTPDIPEEKLLTVDKPIVELKISPTNPLIMGNSNDDEEDLAQLEAMEQENLEEREQVDRVTSNFLSYGDVGYGPIDMTVSRPIVTLNPAGPNGQAFPNGGQNVAISRGCSGPGCASGGMVASTVDEFGPEPPCGPLGPPLEDYVPGNVILQRKYFESEIPREPTKIDGVYGEDSTVGSQEDDASSTSIIARLRSAARKYGGSKLCSR